MEAQKSNAVTKNKSLEHHSTHASINHSKHKNICAVIAQIPGCACTGVDAQRIRCNGVTVTQESINKVIKVLTEVKPQLRLHDGWFKLLFIADTNMTDLDLTPLLGFRFDMIIISHNYLLSTITGPPMESLSEDQKIHVRDLNFTFNPKLDDQGFGQTLKYIAPKFLHKLNILHMKLEGVLRDKSWQVNHKNPHTEKVPEFLPGLGAFTELKTLEIIRNGIGRIGDGQFRKNNKLTHLNLRGNKLHEIWEGAFDFDEGEKSEDHLHQDHKLIINLDECHLTPYVFVHKKMDWPKHKCIHLHLDNNKLETLPQEIFQSFLDANPKNELHVLSNPINCDPAMNWVRGKEGMKKYKTRVFLICKTVSKKKH